MGDYADFAASLVRLRAYSSKHRISTYEYGLVSADAMHAILLGEFAEAERIANLALEIGEAQGELATGGQIQSNIDHPTTNRSGSPPRRSTCR